MCIRQMLRIFRHLTSPLITLIVGIEDKAKTFAAHSGLLADASGYFERALRSDFRESTEGCFHLDEDIPETVSCFITWFYTRRING